MWFLLLTNFTNAETQVKSPENGLNI